MTQDEAIKRLESMCAPSLRPESAMIVREDVEAIRAVLAQIEAGRALAEAARTLMDRHTPAANTNTRSNQWDTALDALAAWDRAAAGEGGET